MEVKLLKINSILFLLLSLYSCSANSGEKALIKEATQKEIGMIAKNNLTKEQITKKVSWKLSKINGENASTVFDKIPTLSFDAVESRISGNAGCNQYNTSYQLNEDSFTTSPARTTRMLCNGKNDESGFLRALESVNSSKIEDNTLIFMENGQIVLEFVKE